MKLKKLLSVGLAAVLSAGILTACGNDDKSSQTEGMNSENDRSFIITLYPDIAPITCENFEKLVSEGFYDGLTFHRVSEDFMAQGGDPNGDGTGGTDTIKGEFSANGVENDLSHTRGVVSMARRSDSYDSGSCQFFICYGDCSFLDGEYAAFGKVTEGMEVVDGFLDVGIELNDYGVLSKPKSTITIVSAKMIDNDSDGNPRAEFTVNYQVQ